MRDFCAEKVSLEKGLRSMHGVVLLGDIAVLNDARSLAEQIIAHAQEQAAMMLSRADEQVRDMTSKAEKDVLTEAESLIGNLNNAQNDLIGKARDVIVDVALALFDRLLVDVSPREKLEASIKRIVSEAPPRLVQAVLFVHPDEKSLVPETDWECKEDRSLPLGCCRLEASSGEWRADFSAAVESLKVSLKSSSSHASATAFDAESVPGE